jgi:hypothetical protein
MIVTRPAYTGQREDDMLDPHAFGLTAPREL